MNTNQISRQVIDFQKMSFNNWYTAMSLVQDQALSSMDRMLGQTAWVPEGGRNAIQSWLNVFQDERNLFKDYVDRGFVVLEKAFSEVPKPAEKAK